ncbi:MAG: ExeM/NucH family extracellular endonuclease, partial [Pseudomonadota bacterium]
MSTTFINEFHYDNDGGDEGEFIEIVGLAGTDLTGWQVELYNGSNDRTYDTLSLSGVLADAGDGYGFAVIDLPANGLQNGSPDGMALIDAGGAVVEFLSYEGVITAVNGSAAGETSTDVGVQESGSTPIGQSLQRAGVGAAASDFAFSAPSAATKGAVNSGQTLVAPVIGTPIFINELHYDDDGADAGEFVEIAGPAGTDLTGWTVVLYNGSGGASYGTVALSGIIDDEGEGFGALSFARAGIQNGAPDGLALVDAGGAVVQFLSYEGTFTATNGPAAGMESEDIGVAETGSTPEGRSLSLAGAGTVYEDFAWTGPGGSTAGDVNGGQIFGVLPTVSIAYLDPNGTGGQDEGDAGAVAFQFVVTRSDATGEASVEYAVVATEADAEDFGGALPADTVRFADGETAATITVDVFGDVLSEGNEVFDVVLASPSAGLALGEDTASARIDNDDGTPVFINELHYDNIGSDTGEFVEIAGPAGTDLTGWTVVTYNGNGGAPDDTIALSGIIDDEGAGFGTLSFARSGIQNGAPDGLALVDAAGGLVQFLSYEGVFTGVGGPADGVESEDIGVAESNASTPAGASLQLIGEGQVYEDFTWTGPATDSPGDVNAGQSFGAPQPGFSISYLDPNDTGGQAEGDAGQTVFQFVVTRNDGTGAASVDFAVVAGATDAADFGGALPRGTATFEDGELSNTVDVIVIGDELVEGDETFEAALSNPSAGFEILGGAASAVIENDDVGMTAISAIQGAGDETPLAGQLVRTRGVVTGQVEGGDTSNGVFIQTLRGEEDGNDATSEGLFVLLDDPLPEVGQVIDVQGDAGEAFGRTVLDNATVLTSAEANTAETPLIDTLTLGVDDLEAHEGMLVSLIAEDGEDIIVTEVRNLDDFGEFRVAAVDEAVGRDYQFTNTDAPDQAGFDAFNADLATRNVIIDDGAAFSDRSPIQPLEDDDDSDAYFDPATFGQPGENETLRIGTTVTEATGVLDFGFGSYRLQPGQDSALTLDRSTAERPTELPITAAPQDYNLLVASVNVLNYFTTVDLSGAATATGQNPRGADSEAELLRQREKMLTALSEIGADVFALAEVENGDPDPTDATPRASADIAAGLSASTGRDYRAVTVEVGAGFETVDVSDAISVEIVYDAGALTLLGAAKLTDANAPAVSADPIFDGSNSNRAPLAATFELNENGETVTVAAVHMKSKGGTGSGANADQGDGQGNWNARRTDGVEAVTEWLAQDPTGADASGRVIVAGDFNAYIEEDPVKAAIEAGYTSAVDLAQDPAPYGFTFDGLQGELDYVFVKDGYADELVDAGTWHVNTDEPDLFDYNLEDRDARFFDGSTPYRFSDHDPILAAFQMRQGRRRVLAH